jgi:glyoxylate reductase
MKVFITKKLPGNIEALLKKNGLAVSVHKSVNPVTKEELKKKSADADALICLLTDKIDKEVIDSFKKCRIIANVAVGYNNIDIEYASKKGIIVTNTPDILTDATADLTMTLLLAAARRVVEGERMMRTGSFKGWDPNLLLGIELKNKVLGIIGAGRIGKAVSYRAKAFGMKIIYSGNRKHPEFEEQLNAKKVSLNELLKKSDFVSVHVPLNQKTYHLLNKDNLKLLKKNAILINSARGEIIDEIELIKALKANKIFAAALDVFENEPNINPELLKLTNVVLLPHIGSATLETRSNMALLAAENVIRVLSRKKAKTPVCKQTN